MRVVRAAGGAALALLALLPVYRFLNVPGTGLAGAATVELASTYAGLATAGLAALGVILVIAGRAVPFEAVAGAWNRLSTWLCRPTPTRFGAVLAVIAGTCAALFNLFILEQQPNLIDAMSQLLHARYLAEGMLAGPASPFGAFWHIQQTLVTEAGWVSQYPPLHVLLLAAGFAAGVPWLVGPLMLAAAIFLTALAVDRLLPARRAEARLGVALAAISPFLVAHAGAYMSHTTAAALAALAVYATARVRAGTSGWTLAAGAALGALLATRPLFAVALGVVVAAGLVAGSQDDGATRLRITAQRLAAVAAGALPCVILLLAYNATLFGHPLRFGYEAALGPDGGLGFGIDPWGNAYGAVEAIGYTSAELHALGVALLEIPLPLVALVGVWLAAARRLEPGTWIVAGWALAPVVANLVYWHHGLFMGPRMLNEAAPAWCVLVDIAAVWLVRALPPRSARTFGYDARSGSAVALVAAVVVGVLALGPLRLWSYRQNRPAALAATATLTQPALVFVHETWMGRTAMRLAAAGMRLDSVETVMRQNATCAAHHLADARERGAADPRGLDFARRAAPMGPSDPLARLRTLQPPDGNRIRVVDGAPWTTACARELAADGAGTHDITPLLWQADLPGLPARRALFVRDLGEARNAGLIAAMPERAPYALVGDPSGGARLIPYAHAAAARSAAGPTVAQ
jgi:hypothetical protein